TACHCAHVGSAVALAVRRPVPADGGGVRALDRAQVPAVVGVVEEPADELLHPGRTLAAHAVGLGLAAAPQTLDLGQLALAERHAELPVADVACGGPHVNSALRKSRGGVVEHPLLEDLVLSRH